MNQNGLFFFGGFHSFLVGRIRHFDNFSSPSSDSQTKCSHKFRTNDGGECWNDVALNEFVASDDVAVATWNVERSEGSISVTVVFFAQI